jgi:branched-chain amino acid transport system permease protein
MRCWLSIVTTVAFVVLVPALLPAFYVTLFGYVGLGTLVALGLVLLTGVSGQTSFGQASFVGFAAYATTLLTKFASAPPIAGLAAGLVLTGSIAWVLGLVTARLSGHFLALVSVAWGISFFSLFGTLPWLHGFNGIGNIPPLSLGPISAESLRVTLGFILAAVAIVMAVSANLLDSRIGRAIRTLNGARLMGESVGIDTVRLSRTVFVIAALYAGIAGFLFAHFQRFISPTPFSLGASIDYLFMVIIGGAGSLWGAPVGAALVVVLRDQFPGSRDASAISNCWFSASPSSSCCNEPLTACFPCSRASNGGIDRRSNRTPTHQPNCRPHRRPPPRPAPNCSRWRRSLATSAGSPRTAT